MNDERQSCQTKCPAEMMIRSPPAAAFSSERTCASPRFRTSIQQEPVRRASGDKPLSSLATVLYHCLAEVFKALGSETSWIVGCESDIRARQQTKGNRIYSKDLGPDVVSSQFIAGLEHSQMEG